MTLLTLSFISSKKDFYQLTLDGAVLAVAISDLHSDLEEDKFRLCFLERSLLLEA